uniref:Uncharacterized protein n=1 Tax=Propionibacterium freudenreichii TaxID=1744 RepID=A0A2C7ATD9_9ACTN
MPNPVHDIDAGGQPMDKYDARVWKSLNEFEAP